MKWEEFKKQQEEWENAHPILSYLNEMRWSIWRGYHKVIDFPQDVKHFFQRAIRGYADSDTWGLYYYLSDWMPKALRDMKKMANGYPAGLNQKTGFKEWKQILEKIARGFEVVNEMDEISYNSKRHKKLEKEFNEGMDLFKKYFRNLWD